MPAARKSVLLVDDDVELAAAEAECLELEGYVVVTARDGRHALSLLEYFAPSVIVLDMMMPGMDGLAFLRAHAATGPRRAPVVAISAFDAYLPLALDQGAVAALAKPLEATALTRVVDEAARGVIAERTAHRAAPPDERERLRAVLELELDRPATTEALDEFTHRVAHIFDVPICLVSIVTRDRQYWHAHSGLPDDLAAACGTPRHDSFCTHAVVAKAALVVQDTHENPLFTDNALVRTRGLRFYAGVPLLTSAGEPVGTLCLLDLRPRPFSAIDLELLSVLARRVLAELDWRQRSRSGDGPVFRHLAWVDEELGVLGRAAFEDALQLSSLRAAQHRSTAALVLATSAEERLTEVRASVEATFPRALVGRLAHDRLAAVVPDTTAAQALPRAREAVRGIASAEACDVPMLLGGVAGFLREAEAARCAAHGPSPG